MPEITRVNKAISVLIANGGTTSAGWSQKETAGGSLITPASFDPTSIKFDVSADGSTWFPLYDQSGNEVQIAAVAASRAYPLPIELFAFPHARLRTSAVGADRTVLVNLMS